MKFSEFMRKARGDISLYELSKRTGITAQQLANYERGKSRATVDKAAAICRALNVTYTIGGMKGGGQHVQKHSPAKHSRCDDGHRV